MQHEIPSACAQIMEEIKKKKKEIEEHRKAELEKNKKKGRKRS